MSDTITIPEIGTPHPFAIETRGLTKQFDEMLAVDHLDLSVTAGTITGLLGGNGAGKTTTMSMLLGLLEPTDGTITMLGEDMRHHRTRIAGQINFSSPYVDLPQRLTVRQNLVIYGLLYGVEDLKGKIAALADELQMTAMLDRRYGSLSAGQKTRAALAKSLINQPRLLLLDEPTASLDPDTADWVRTLLLQYRDRTGATIFMASHNMVEVERMCDDVVMMKQGRIVARGTPAALIATYGRDNLEEVFLDIARNRSLHD
ncbi:MAG: ABC transporter ATP-binding protein [Alphaproteobacteria bacterium]|nr:ABC transporter ATP-binding protein [Alphaproteobacteria bacterium]MBV8548412.1 ABC transporter ATP-binding protein [Alphaproteobacteria bacterium]